MACIDTKDESAGERKERLTAGKETQRLRRGIYNDFSFVVAS